MNWQTLIRMQDHYNYIIIINAPWLACFIEHVLTYSNHFNFRSVPNCCLRRTAWAHFIHGRLYTGWPLDDRSWETDERHRTRYRSFVDTVTYVIVRVLRYNITDKYIHFKILISVRSYFFLEKHLKRKTTPSNENVKNIRRTYWKINKLQH